LRLKMAQCIFKPLIQLINFILNGIRIRTLT